RLAAESRVSSAGDAGCDSSPEKCPARAACRGRRRGSWRPIGEREGPRCQPPGPGHVTVRPRPAFRDQRSCRLPSAPNRSHTAPPGNRTIMATPWPDKPCPSCGQTITDLLLEMVPDADQATADYRAISQRQPGGAVTCPYCQTAVEYHPNGADLVQSSRVP